MNIVNYIRFGQDSRSGAQQQPHPPKDGFPPEDSEEAPPELAEASPEVKPIPVPEYTTGTGYSVWQNCRIERL